ncbi:MAG: adenosylcobinamide-GDP ribazoletransferase [Nocardioides sp.]
MTADRWRANREAWRLILGTLSILPVTPPNRVDALIAGRAATFAPLVGGALAGLVALPAWLVTEWVAPEPLAPGTGAPLLLATICLTGIALLTRAIHLDGLADTADGFGSRADRQASLAIMSRSDIGPFGVVTLILVLLLQVCALAACFSADVGPAGLAVALILSRAGLPLLCRHPAARPHGLGSAFASTIKNRQMVVAGLMALGLCVPVIAASDDRLWWQLIFHPVALVPLWRLERLALRRLGGMTGDVYGAGIELSFATSLVAAALAALVAG